MKPLVYRSTFGLFIAVAVFIAGALVLNSCFSRKKEKALQAKMELYVQQLADSTRIADSAYAAYRHAVYVDDSISEAIAKKEQDSIDEAMRSAEARRRLDSFYIADSLSKLKKGTKKPK